MDLFEAKDITPMLIGRSSSAFDSSEYIFELKLDGIRCLAYLWNGGMELQNKKNRKLNSIYPELRGLEGQVKNRCILDGELVILNGGKPDFFELRRRSLMSNPVKIELAAMKLPVCFTAFDILYRERERITDLSLMERKRLLSDTVMETPKLAVSRFISTNGHALYQAAKESGLEGIVAKKKESKYYCGKRTGDWIKVKNLLDEDFVVCGYYLNENNLINVILGSYEGGRLVYQGRVALGVSSRDYREMMACKKSNKEDYPDFPDLDGVVWLVPRLVCCVQYMERTPSDGLRQPVFKGLREDKYPQECTRNE